MKENPNTLGKYLRTERLKRKMTLDDVAKIIPLSPSQISAIERGMIHCPTPRTIERLAMFSELSPLQLAKMVDIKSHQLYYFIDKIEEAERNGE